MRTRAVTLRTYRAGFQPASLTVLHGLTALRLVSLVQLKQEGSTACMPALLALMAANAGCEVVTFRANVELP